MEELIGSAAGGGLLGFVGSLANRAFGVWERREERENMRVEHAHELAMIQEQRISSAQETEQEIVRLQTEGSYRGLEASLNNDSSFQNVSPWVNNVRALTRPILTYSSFAALAFLTAFVPDLQISLAEAVTFVATTSAVWWFGDRAPRATLR